MKEQKTIEDYIIYFFKPFKGVNIESAFKRLISIVVVFFIAVFLSKSTAGIDSKLLILNEKIINNSFVVFTYWLSFVGLLSFGIYFLIFRLYKFQFWQYLVFGAVLTYYYFLKLVFQGDNWELIKLNVLFNIVDPFAILFIVFVLIKICFSLWLSIPKAWESFCNWRNDIEEKKPTIFLEDNPLDSEEDTANYKNLLEQINPILYTDKYEKSFSVAIVGAWGSGKSSFIKALTKNIDDYNGEHLLKVEKQVLHFNFSPFLNHDENSIIKEFFTKLSHVLGKRSGKLSNQLIAYSKKLTNLAKEGDLLSFLTPVQSELFNQSAHELYESISDTIESLNVKIVITIDDLDRLSGNEILEVLKLIRNTSNFPNTIFFVALDKEYILRTIEDVNENFTTQYLDKFFQMEISIAKVPIYRILQYLEKKLVVFLKSISIKEFGELDDLYRVKSINIHISSYREAKRFYNQFVLDFKLVNQLNQNGSNNLEVQVIDLINLTLLKLYYPYEYNLLFKDELDAFKEDKKCRVLTFNNLIEYSETSVLDVIKSVNEISVKSNENSIFFHIKHECQYLLIKLFGVEVDRSKKNLDLSDIVSPNSMSNKENLRRYFERTNYEGKEMSNGIYSRIVSNGINHRNEIEKTFKERSYFDSFINRLIKDNELDSIIKVNCLNEVLILKKYHYKNVSDSLLFVMSKLYLKDKSIFDEVFVSIIKNERLSFKKKSFLISDLYSEGKSIELNDRQSNVIINEIKKGAQFLLDNLTLGMSSGLDEFYDIWNYFQKGSIQEVLSDLFILNFPKQKFVWFCESQLMYKKNQKGYVYMRPILKSLIGSSNEVLKKMNTIKEDSDKFNELKRFFELQNIFEGFNPLIPRGSTSG